MTQHSTLNTTWHLIFESIPEVVTLSSQRRTAKLSGLSGFKPCAALNRNGMAKAARAGHTRRYAKLAVETAKHRKLQECKVLTWLFVRWKTAQAVAGSNFEHNSGVYTMESTLDRIGGNHIPNQPKNYIYILARTNRNSFARKRVAEKKRFSLYDSICTCCISI